jgi:hypothetical protein
MSSSIDDFKALINRRANACSCCCFSSTYISRATYIHNCRRNVETHINTHAVLTIIQFPSPRFHCCPGWPDWAICLLLTVFFFNYRSSPEIGLTYWAIVYFWTVFSSTNVAQN